LPKAPRSRSPPGSPEAATQRNNRSLDPTLVVANPIRVGEYDDITAGRDRLEVAVIVLGHLSECQRRQLGLADNRRAMNARSDAYRLKFELRDLEEFGHGLTDLGLFG
jgi:hypothetical protein